MNDKIISAPNKSSYCFLFYEKDEVLLKESEGCPQFPLISEVEKLGIDVSNIIFIGTLYGNDYYALNVLTKDNMNGFYFEDIAEIYGDIDESIYMIALRGLHMRNWLNRTRYCSSCGDKVKVDSRGTSIKCSNCGQATYPSNNPAILVAVLKEDKILLARSSHFTPNMFSLISGFVDLGETLETSVKREVMEEVGIEIKNIKYFGSFPWPFSTSLMIGFIAEYSSGELTIDNNEIEAAEWFSLDDLPKIPEYKVSFARRIINSVLEDRKQTNNK